MVAKDLVKPLIKKYDSYLIKGDNFGTPFPRYTMGMIWGSAEGSNWFDIEDGVIFSSICSLDSANEFSFSVVTEQSNQKIKFSQISENSMGSYHPSLEPFPE